MAYHHLRLNVHDVSLYVIAILLFALLLSLLYCVCRNVDKTIILSTRSSRKSSYMSSRRHSFLLQGEADPRHDGCQAAQSITPKASNASLKSLTEHQKEILEIHCEECEGPKNETTEKSSPKTTIFSPHNDATITLKNIV